MTIEFPSEEWIEEWQRRLNENERYAELGADWGLDFNGDFVFTIEADDRFDETQHYFVGLEGGKCTDAYRVEDLDEVNYGFEMRGPYSHWRQLSDGDVGAIDGLMQGKFKLNGDMQEVLQYTDASVEMVECAAQIETEYIE